LEVEWITETLMRISSAVHKCRDALRQETTPQSDISTTPCPEAELMFKSRDSPARYEMIVQEALSTSKRSSP
jgi:hypothetical protein